MDNSQPTDLTTTSSKSIQTATCVIADAIYTWSIVFAFVTYTVVDVWKLIHPKRNQMRRICFIIIPLDAGKSVARKEG